MVHLGRTEEQTMIEMIETNAIRPLTAEETLVVGLAGRCPCAVQGGQHASAPPTFNPGRAKEARQRAEDGFGACARRSCALTDGSGRRWLGHPRRRPVTGPDRVADSLYTAPEASIGKTVQNREIHRECKRAYVDMEE
jgi:hypothetical protein